MQRHQAVPLHYFPAAIPIDCFSISSVASDVDHYGYDCSVHCCFKSHTSGQTDMGTHQTNNDLQNGYRMGPSDVATKKSHRPRR